MKKIVIVALFATIATLTIAAAIVLDTIGALTVATGIAVAMGEIVAFTGIIAIDAMIARHAELKALRATIAHCEERMTSLKYELAAGHITTRSTDLERSIRENRRAAYVRYEEGWKRAYCRLYALHAC